MYSNHFANTWISWSCLFQLHRMKTFYRNCKSLQYLWQEVANLVTISAHLSTRTASCKISAQTRHCRLQLLHKLWYKVQLGPPHYPLCKGKSPHVAQWSFVHEFTVVTTAGDETEFRQFYAQHFEDKFDKFQAYRRSRVVGPEARHREESAM